MKKNFNELMEKVDDAVIYSITKIANEKFTVEELRAIRKSGLNKNEVISLACWYNSKKKQNWANSLIIKEFLLYRAQIDSIMGVESWLYSQGICNNDRHYNTANLRHLSEVLIENDDFELFIDICEKYLGLYGLTYIMSQFLKAKNEPMLKNI